jgi:uncharacterized protein (TIGR00255 family)
LTNGSRPVETACMKSMTGYGRSSSRLASEKKSEASVELDISLKSVNGRYLEIRLHVPREYAALESEFKSLIGAKFSRGTVDVYINRLSSAASSEIKVNVELARKWLESYRKLGSSLKLSADPSLEMISRVPDVLSIEAHVEPTEAEKRLVKKLLQETVSACDLERSREGKALETELQSLLKKLETLADQMQDMRKHANDELEKRYRDRLQKLGFAGVVDDQRVAQEIVMQIDRSDISEEQTRLREHLKAYRQLFKSKEPQGKKLDFYAQELLREVNTIGSKSHIAKLTGLVVDAKTLVEKIREQVQNVE